MKTETSEHAGLTGHAGLSEAEAARRLADHGPNALPDPSRRGVLRIALEVLKEPMFLLLVACGGLYLVLGDPKEASMLLVAVCAVIGLTVAQERRTERALESLRELSQPRAVVVRDGQRRSVATREVVPGDLIVIAEGERVPADGVLMEGGGASVDESLLTGESAPVRKRLIQHNEARDGAPGGEDTPWLFGGTLVVRGQGLVELTATGVDTQMGRIGAALATLTPGRSALQAETRRLVRVVAVAAFALSAAVTLVYGLNRGAWIEGLLSGLATAMALLPEEFPVVLTVFLALGARRIARVGVLTRRMSAVEALGATTVLCTDKTGTLTQNRMTVRALWTPEASVELGAEVGALDEALHDLVEHAVLASPEAPNDPMEIALHALGDASLSDTEHLHPSWGLRREYPLSSAMLAMTRAWHTAEGEPTRQASAKGSPEAIFDLCHLDPGALAALSVQTEAYARRGLRVLGVAHASVAGEALPDDPHDFAFQLDGLVAFEDPLRAEVPAAIARCQEAGLRVLMITGDYPATAASIAQAAGLPPGAPLAGPELADLDDEALLARLRQTSVAARITPEDKLRLVQVLKAAGEVVAMTGDGVNDAPALSAADIGVAMGRRGTEVAREAAALVLLEDDFGSLVAAIAQGRRVFDNLRKSMTYIVAVHVPIAGLAILPVLFGLPPALLPVHIVLLELVIDPACSLVFEAEPAEEDLMRRPPRDASALMLDGHALLTSLLQGVCVLCATLVALVWADTRPDAHPDAARSLAFATLLMGNLSLILANRSWTHSGPTLLRRPNPVFWWVAGGAVLLTLIVMYVPGLNALLHFVPLPPSSLAPALLGGLACALLIEGLKWATQRRCPYAGKVSSRSSSTAPPTAK